MIPACIGRVALEGGAASNQEQQGDENEEPPCPGMNSESDVVHTNLADYLWPGRYD